MLLQRVRQSLTYFDGKVLSASLSSTQNRSLATMGVPQAVLEAKLREKLECTHVELSDLSDGCGQKFAAIIVSPQFVGEKLARLRVSRRNT